MRSHLAWLFFFFVAVVGVTGCFSSHIKMTKEQNHYVLKEKKQPKFEQYMGKIPFWYVKMVKHIDIRVADNVSRLEVNEGLVTTIPFRQKLVYVKVNYRPYNVFDMNQYRFADWVWLGPSSKMKFRLEMVFKLWRYDFYTKRRLLKMYPFLAKGLKKTKTRAALPGLVTPLTAREKQKYLRSEKFIEVHHPKLRKAAAKLKHKNVYRTIYNSMTFVADHMNYLVVKGYKGGLYALKYGIGDCAIFSDFLITLLRINGVPARLSVGVVASVRGRRDNPRHAWVQAWVDKVGWIPLDPTHFQGRRRRYRRALEFFEGDIRKTDSYQKRLKKHYLYMPNYYVFQSNRRKEYFRGTMRWYYRGSGGGVKSDDYFRFYRSKTLRFKKKRNTKDK